MKAPRWYNRLVALEEFGANPLPKTVTQPPGPIVTPDVPRLVSSTAVIVQVVKAHADVHVLVLAPEVAVAV